LQERKREIGSWAFASEFMNNPVSDETAPIKESQIRYWKELPGQYSCVIAVDPAYSEDEKSDYKVASLIAIDPQFNRYLVRYVRTHAPIGEFEDAIINLFIGWRQYITQVGIPNSGVEKGFFESFAKKCQMRGIISIPVVELKNVFTSTTTQTSSRNKKARIIAALQPIFEQGKYYIHPDHIEARDELLTIGSSRWDDLTDSMAYAEQILTPVFYETGNQQAQEALHMVRGTSGYGEEY
jgi:phage terminase large subunit-like protein